MPAPTGGVTTRAGARRWSGIGAGLLGALVALVAALWVGGTAPPPLTGHGVSGPAAALRAVLAAQLTAVRDHDRAGYAATLADPGAPGGRELLARYATMTRLPLEGTRVVSTSALPGGRGTSAEARAVVGYRLRGFDRAEQTSVVRASLTQVAGEWRLEALADEARRGEAAAPWALAGARVHETPGALVIGDLDDAALAGYARQAGAAVKAVDAARAQPWPRRIVVLAPRSAAGWTRLVGSPPDPGGQVGAVTLGAVDGRGVASGDRVVLEPGAFARLTEAGRGFVMTHECVHVAVRATTPGQVPLWLSEGYADHVAYAATGLTPARAAGGVLAEVRAGRGPTRLPDDGDFAPGPDRPDVLATYLVSWLAVDHIAEAHGEEGLRRFYRAVAEGGAAQPARATVDGAARVALGVSEQELTASWQAWLRDLARG